MLGLTGAVSPGIAREDKLDWRTTEHALALYEDESTRSWRQSSRGYATTGQDQRQVRTSPGRPPRASFAPILKIFDGPLLVREQRSNRASAGHAPRRAALWVCRQLDCTRAPIRFNLELWYGERVAGAQVGAVPAGALCSGCSAATRRCRTAATTSSQQRVVLGLVSQTPSRVWYVSSAAADPPRDPRHMADPPYGKQPPQYSQQPSTPYPPASRPIRRCRRPIRHQGPAITAARAPTAAAARLSLRRRSRTPRRSPYVLGVIAGLFVLVIVGGVVLYLAFGRAPSPRRTSRWATACQRCRRHPGPYGPYGRMRRVARRRGLRGAQMPEGDFPGQSAIDA